MGDIAGVATVALLLLIGLATLVAGAGRTTRFWVCLALSIWMGAGLLFSDGMLVSAGRPPWDPQTAATFVLGIMVMPWIVQALLLGLFAGRAAVRWVLGTIAVAGLIVSAIAGLAFASDPSIADHWPGLLILIVVTILAGGAWIVLLRGGWLRDTGAPPWDLRKARSTFLGRSYMR